MTDRTHPDSGIPFTYGNYVSYEEHMQTLHAKIEELEAELAKARKPCLLQISEPEGEYPPLPAPDMETAAGMKYYHQGKLRAYVDADRAMRESARPTETPTCEDASYESLNLAEMVLSDCGHSGNYKPLLERVAGRIDRHVERLLTAQQADRAIRAQAAPAAVAVPSKAVAYLDIGSGGYLDIGTDLDGEELLKLPSGRHMLAIVGTFGVDGYTPAAAPTTQAAPQPAPIFGDEDHVLVPRGMLGAACSAIDKKRDGVKTLAELRRYTTGDLSKAAPQQDDQKPYAYAVYFPDQPTVELVHDLDELTDDLTNREHQITKLYAAPQAAPAAQGDAEDAARYRWLRDPATNVALVLDKRTGYVPKDERFPGVGGYHIYEYRAGDELDAAIDAARSQAKEGGS